VAQGVGPEFKTQDHKKKKKKRERKKKMVRPWWRVWVFSRKKESVSQQPRRETLGVFGEFNENSEAWGVTQWYSACLACTRSCVPAPQEKKKKKRKGRRKEGGRKGGTQEGRGNSRPGVFCLFLAVLDFEQDLARARQVLYHL
jgi:hypothetical protein